MILWLTLLLVLALCVLVLVLFLPALLELRKPKDAGPREILGIAMEGIPRYAPPSARPPKLSHIVKEHIPENLIHALNNLEGKEISKPSVDVIRLAGEVELPSDIEITENLVVDGSLEIGDRCCFHRSVKASKDVHVGSDVIIEGNLIAGGSVELGNGSVVNGLVDSGGLVVLGRNVSVRRSVTSGRDIELRKTPEEGTSRPLDR